jgi:hypothetical protein
MEVTGQLDDLAVSQTAGLDVVVKKRYWPQLGIRPRSSSPQGNEQYTQYILAYFKKK